MWFSETTINAWWEPRISPSLLINLSVGVAVPCTDRYFLANLAKFGYNNLCCFHHNSGSLSFFSFFSDKYLSISFSVFSSSTSSVSSSEEANPFLWPSFFSRLSVNHGRDHQISFEIYGIYGLFYTLKNCQNPNLTSTQWLGLTIKWLCKPHPTPQKLNVSNISAVTDPILMKL